MTIKTVEASGSYSTLPKIPSVRNTSVVSTREPGRLAFASEE